MSQGQEDFKIYKYICIVVHKDEACLFPTECYKNKVRLSYFALARSFVHTIDASLLTYRTVLIHVCVIF